MVAEFEKRPIEKIKLNTFIIGIRELSGYIIWFSFITIFSVEIVAFFGHFRFSFTNFDDHLNGQSFKTASSGCMCT